MRVTPFAGLTALEPGEPFSTDGFSFQDRNPDLTDRLLRVGAISHRHDQHSALASPTASGALSVDTASGSIPAGVTAVFGYTLVDAFGGETLLSDVVDIATPGKIDAPQAPSGSADYAAGALLAGAYSYVKTWIDGFGGETVASISRTITIDPGHASGRLRFVNLASGMATAGAAGWRLYKSQNGGAYHYIASGTGNTLDDAGQLCADCVTRPPTTNTTSDHNSLTFTMPSGALPSAATSFRIYGTVGVGFDSPSFFGEFPAASASATFSWQSWSPGTGRPPAVSTTIPGASKIDAETELTNFHAGSWKESVAGSANLPSGAIGDVRLVRTASALYGVLGASASGAGGWSQLTASGAGGGGGGGSPEAWTALTLFAATVSDYWTAAPYYFGTSNTVPAPSPAYYKDDQGRVWLQGVINAHGFTPSTFNVGDQVASVPLDHAPADAHIQIIEGWDNGASNNYVALIQVDPDGAIRWRGYIYTGFNPNQQGGSQLNLAGVSFRAA